jgi:hypothetical protein
MLYDCCARMPCSPHQARSQEARSNWETALQSKDRAIQQLEEALASRQRALVSLAAACAREQHHHVWCVRNPQCCMG